MLFKFLNIFFGLQIITDLSRTFSSCKIQIQVFIYEPFYIKIITINTYSTVHERVEVFDEKVFDEIHVGCE